MEFDELDLLEEQRCREEQAARLAWWRCSLPRNFTLRIRAEPSVDAPRTNYVLKDGEAFQVLQQVLDEQGVRFLELADGRGWAFDADSDWGVLCTPLLSSGVPESPDIKPGELHAPAHLEVVQPHATVLGAGLQHGPQACAVENTPKLEDASARSPGDDVEPEPGAGDPHPAAPHPPQRHPAIPTHHAPCSAAPHPPQPLDAWVPQRPQRGGPQKEQREEAKAAHGAGFAPGATVALLQAVALRRCEDVSSEELAELDRGETCLVLATGTAVGSRRLLVRRTKTLQEGWITCATKAGRLLVKLLEDIPLLDLAEEAAATDTSAIPQLDELLANIDSMDNLPVEEGVEGDPAAIWQEFADIGHVDEIVEEGPAQALSSWTPRVDDPETRLHWSEWQELDEEYGELMNNRRRRLMEREQAKRGAVQQELVQRLERARDVLEPQWAAHIPRMREIGGPASSLASASKRSSATLPGLRFGGGLL